MKQIAATLLCLAVMFSLCSCAGLEAIKDTELPPLPTMETEPTPQPAANTEPTPQPAAETPVPAKPDEEGGQGASLGDRVTVYMGKFRELSYAPDNEDLVILDFSYVTPTVRIDGNSAVSAAINEQLRLFDELYYTGTGRGDGKNSLLEAAIDNYAYAMEKGAEVNLEFSSARTVKAMRADASVISLVYTTSVYTGGTQGEYGYTGLCFDTQSGEKLSLDTVSADAEALRTLLRSYIVSLAREDGELYARIAESGGDTETAIGAIVRDGAWYFSSDGMVFFPQMGELCPPESGIPTFTVPYSELAGVIEDRFMPVERTGECSLDIVRVGDVEDGTVWSIDRLAVSDGEEMYLIVTGTAYDVSISSVRYADHGERFFETERHWYASFMTDCALQISALVPEGMPELMIIYTDANYVQHRLFISESGRDGSLILVDDSIEAVG